MLITKTQQVDILCNYWLNNVLHSSTNISCVYQELIGLFWLLTENFLPESNPQLNGQSSIKLRLSFGIKRKPIIDTTRFEDYVDTVLI